jgi:hypothetical protein
MMVNVSQSAVLLEASGLRKNYGSRRTTSCAAGSASCHRRSPSIRRSVASAISISTHYMEEVERICSRALLLDRGKAVATGTITELIALGGRHPVMELTFEGAAPRDWCDGLAGIKQIGVASANGKVGLQIESFALVNPILARARVAGARVREFSVRASNLSDAFISLTGNAPRDLVPNSRRCGTAGLVRQLGRH